MVKNYLIIGNPVEHSLSQDIITGLKKIILIHFIKKSLEKNQLRTLLKNLRVEI